VLRVDQEIVMSLGTTALRLTRRLGATIALLVALTPTAAVSGEAHIDDSDVGVVLDVLGCHMPLPPGFVINTKERAVTSLYSKNLSNLTRVVVEPYPVRGIDDLYRTISSQALGRLRVVRLSVRTPSGKGALVDRLTMITDDEQAVLLYAAAEALEQRMINGCLATRSESD
jgi:hypothetical protein